MRKILFLLVAFFCMSLKMIAQQLNVSFTNNLNDSSINHYLLDTNNCGNVYSFCDDASGNANSAYQFDGLCGIQTDSFSMTNTVYDGFSVSFYMNKNFDSSAVQYGLMHFYKGNFLVYALHDSLFITVTDSGYNDHTYGVPCNFPNDEWFCTVITFTDYGAVDFYFNKVKYHAGTAAYRSLRKECVPGFCYPFHISTDIWSNEFYKGKLDDIRVWNWPSDSVNVDEICKKVIIPAGLNSFEQGGLQLYPNPALDHFILECEAEGLSILYDITGRAVIRQAASEGVNRINTGSLPGGQYILIHRNKNGVFSSKIEIR